jgi:hypothetical protein
VKLLWEIVTAPEEYGVEELKTTLTGKLLQLSVTGL